MWYSKSGKTNFDENGNLTPDGQLYSLNHLISNCVDFKEEKSDQEHICTEISSNHTHISVTFTPKFHCELAVEGIEYSWDVTKTLYHGIPYHQKCSFKKFAGCVHQFLSKVSISIAHQFFQKSRSYMLGYHHQSVVNESDDSVLVKEESTFEYNEKIRKLHKSHQDASTTDFSFISTIIKECII